MERIDLVKVVRFDRKRLKDLNNSAVKITNNKYDSFLILYFLILLFIYT